MKKLAEKVQNLKNRSYTFYKSTVIKIRTFAEKRPLASLFVLLFLLILVIVVSNLVQNGDEDTKETEVITTSVEVYRIGEAPRINVQAQVEKSGVITISALSPGVVQQLFVEPGTPVSAGQTLLTTSTNYQGGNAAALQSAIVARQLQNINDTYDTNKELIQQQRELTEKSDENDNELREITRQSLDATRSLIEFNDETIELLEEQWETDPDDIFYRNALSSAKAGNEQLRSSLRNAEYYASDDNPPAELSDIQKDIALKQLEIQTKALDLNRDIAKLQYQLAKVQEATMYPSSPFNAVVQRVSVKIGEAVQPGTPLVVLSQNIEEDPIVALAFVPREVAMKVSYIEPSRLKLDDIVYETFPSYVSRDAIQGTLYAVYLPIPDMYHQKVTSQGYIEVSLPVGLYDTSASLAFIPIDSVYQSDTKSTVLVVEEDMVVEKSIVLGTITGRYVQVRSGLEAGDDVILNRNVVAGDKVKIMN